MKKVLLSAAVLSILSLTSCSDSLNSFEDLPASDATNKSGGFNNGIGDVSGETIQIPVRKLKTSGGFNNGIGDVSGETIQIPVR